MTKRKICVITTSRADYGLLYWLMRAIDVDPELQLQVIASGMHMSSEFGLTFREVSRDFPVTEQIEMLLSGDSSTAIAKSIGLGCISFADAFARLRPDLVVILGDRFELLSAGIAALFGRIPIAHLHGGETSEGALDEYVRHALTKMASLHFVANEAYRNRVIQMGEQPSCVYNLGSPALDNIARMKKMTRRQLASRLKFDLSGRVALVTYHPVTSGEQTGHRHLKSMMTAIRRSGVKAVFTQTNADLKGRWIDVIIRQACAAQPKRFCYVQNLGRNLYLNCMRDLDIMIGNSSSGLIEAPSFGMPVVNIGDRQKGRVRGENVIDSDNSTSSIQGAIAIGLDVKFRERISKAPNPYANGSTKSVSSCIKEKLIESLREASPVRKRFFDFEEK